MLMNAKPVTNADFLYGVQCNMVVTVLGFVSTYNGKSCALYQPDRAAA